MSEVQSRPVASRGRGSGRGGRGGGHSTRGGSRVASRTAAPNGESKHTTDAAQPSLDDDAELGEIKKKYGGKINIIREVCPGWSEADAAYALDETNGDENLAIDRILGGLIQKWEQSNKKERTRPKGKNDTFTTTTADSAPAGGARPARGGRGTESGRGGRGRATERGGRGSARGKSAAATTNGSRTKDSAQLSVPTEEAFEWKSADEGSTTAPEPPVEPVPVTAPAPVAIPKPAENAPKTWASMLRESTAPKPAPKPKETPVAKPAEPIIEPLPPAESTPAEPEAPASEEEATPEPEEEIVLVANPAPEPVTVVVPEIALPPSKDQLTETNLEQIADVSHPAPTGTARSEATDSWDPRAQAPSATATPLSASQQQHQARAPTSGYAATATKATERAATRTPSHSRRILEQREAVRMPGNRDQVDRAAVQFGAFSLNDDDIDGDREEPETRPQPPEDSPVAHPRTSLPPAQPAPVPEAFPAQKPAPSLPPTGPASSVPAAPQPASNAPSQAVQPPTGPSAQQFGRFGQPVPQESASFQTSSKPFDSFPQQQQSTASAAPSQFDGGFPSQAQPAQPQTQQQPGGAFSSAPGEFSSYYTADPQSRNAYNYYNQGFGQQGGAQSQQEGLSSQAQRSFSNYNAPQNDNLSQYPQSGAQGRFSSTAAADTQAGATPTPNQTAAQGQTSQTAQAQSHGHQQPQDFYGSHPYSFNPYYSNYMGYQGGYSQAGYGGPYGKGGLGYQPSQYGMSPQGPHGYGSSPGGGFAQSSGLHRESGISAGLSDYTRAGSGQSTQQQGLASSGFGGMHDAFSRNASAYQSQTGQSFNAPGPQPGNGPSASDDLKPFGDAKSAGGPSPSLGAAARPGSAANNAPSQTGLPPPQSAQQGGLGGYGYPGHLQGHGLHGNQSGGGGGYGMSASGGQGHQNSYGTGYGNGGFGNYYGNPPRGWGTNYH